MSFRNYLKFHAQLFSSFNRCWKFNPDTSFATNLLPLFGPFATSGTYRLNEEELSKWDSIKLLYDTCEQDKPLTRLGTLHSIDGKEWLNLGRKSPIGKGNETVFDENIRKSKELSFDEIIIRRDDEKFDPDSKKTLAKESRDLFKNIFKQALNALTESGPIVDKYGEAAIYGKCYFEHHKVCCC